MATMTELVLIRHGETAWNRELRFQGHVDVGLNEVGFEQSRRLAQRLAGERATRLVASDLLRARQTAQPLADQLGLAMHVDAALREQSFGVVDGMKVDDIQLLHPLAWAGWLRFEQDHRMPEGESLRQFHARVMGAIGALASVHAAGSLVIVTHGGVLDMVYRTALGLGLDGPRQSEIPNAGLNRVRIGAGGGIEILRWADVDHLAGMAPQPVYDQKKLLATDDKPSTA